MKCQYNANSANEFCACLVDLGCLSLPSQQCDSATWACASHPSVHKRIIHNGHNASVTEKKYYIMLSSYSLSSHGVRLNIFQLPYLAKPPYFGRVHTFYFKNNRSKYTQGTRHSKKYS